MYHVDVWLELGGGKCRALLECMFLYFNFM